MFRSPSSVGLLDAIFDAVRTQLRMVRQTGPAHVLTTNLHGKCRLQPYSVSLMVC